MTRRISATSADWLQPLLVDARRVQVLVVDDRVVHAHAALVEDAEDRHPVGQLAGQAPPESRRRRRRARRRRGRGRGDVSCSTVPVSSQRAIAASANGVGEVLAPDGAVGAAHLRQRGVDVEHARRGPATGRSSWRRSGSARDGGAGPARTWWLYCQTASATTSGASRSIAGEDVHAHALAGDEAVAARRVHGMARAGPSRRAARTPPRRCRSSSAWAGQPSRFAVSRRSPLATRTALRDRHAMVPRVDWVGSTGRHGPVEPRMTRLPTRSTSWTGAVGSWILRMSSSTAWAPIR